MPGRDRRVAPWEVPSGSARESIAMASPHLPVSVVPIAIPEDLVSVVAGAATYTAMCLGVPASEAAIAVRATVCNMKSFISGPIRPIDSTSPSLASSRSSRRRARARAKKLVPDERETDVPSFPSSPSRSSTISGAGTPKHLDFGKLDDDIEVIDFDGAGMCATANRFNDGDCDASVAVTDVHSVNITSDADCDGLIAADVSDGARYREVIRISPAATLHDLKRMIKRSCGMKICFQTLKHGETVLDNNDAQLYTHGLKGSCVISLSCRSHCDIPDAAFYNESDGSDSDDDDDGC